MIQNTRSIGALLLLVIFTVIAPYPVLADEGMWTFDNPPVKLLQEKYGFVPTQEWLDHVRLASVRFNDGGSGSFVSPNGLVLTNHHVALGQLQKMSSEGKDYVSTGFYAATLAEEIKCTDLELNVLISIQNVTDKVLGALKPDMTDKAALDARKAIIAAITKEQTEKTGLRSDIVSLYQGGEYWLYQYKKYTDVRLVIAPEQQIAFYGGDPDNFTYPRYDIDFTIFRVYENDKPIQPQHYLKWKTAGAADGELVFVSGHPGSTNRMQTYAQIEHARDFQYAQNLQQYKRILEVLKKYSALGPEQARRAAGQIFGIENGVKALTGEYEGLLDKNLMAKKAAEEKDLREKVNANPEWKKAYGSAWDSIAVAMERSKAMVKPQTYRGLAGRFASLALNIVRYVSEIKKPNGERLPQYQDANLASTQFRLFSRAPIYADMDEVQLADRLTEAKEVLGPNDPFVVAVIGTKNPADVAKEAVNGTSLADVEFRKKLIDGGEEAVKASTDPMIVLARKVAPMGDEMRKWTEANVSGVITSASEKIGKARFAVYGKDTYPDATFTLRLSYGTVKGYAMNGTIAPPMTTMYGLFDRATSFGNKGPFALPQRYIDGIGKLNLATPMDFVTTHDIIGGNSGSPVMNKDGELVGLVFDGNIESLPGRFLYSDEKNRCVAVHPGAIIETMRKLYGAGPVADELEGVVVKPEPPKEPEKAPVKEAPKPVKKKK